MTEVIRTEALSKSYGKRRGLAGLDLEVRPGEVYGFLGPNGAGKTTTIRILLDLIRPTRGRATVLGEAPRAGGPALRRRIGYLPGDFTVHGAQTARQLLAHLAHLRGGIPDGQITDLADRFDLDLGVRIGSLSKGNRQKVGVVQAFMHDPELLILDEPLGGMDPIMRRRTIRLVKDWARAGKHIIVSSHILHEIESMTSNILLINNGRILAEGNVHQIRDLIDTHPHTVYVRGGDPRALARRFLAEDDVLSLKFESGAVIVETARPDSFYARLTELAASGEAGPIDEVQSPDDNLQAVFKYLVKQ